jgi:ssDNA-binding replication factor A large subunit
MLYNYNQLIDKLARASSLTVEDIDRKVEAKCAKLSGLISKEGAAQIVASELGISFEKEKLKVSELVSGMKRVNLIGKIIELNPIKEYNKNGKSGKIAAMNVADDSGNIRTLLWDTNHIQLFEDQKIKNGDTVEISNGMVRNDELHLSSFSEIKLSKEVLENVKIEKIVHEKNISDLKVGENVKFRAVMLQIFEPKFFEVCPQCSKKVMNGLCEEHGNIIPVKRALLSIILDDGTENMRAVLFNDQLKLLGLNEENLENPEKFLEKKNELLGQEAFFSANVRNNKLFNTTELIINGIEQINIDGLIQILRG